MAKDQCGTCNGQGGWWDHGNGEVGKPPKQTKAGPRGMPIKEL